MISEFPLMILVNPEGPGNGDQREVHRQIFEGDETIDYAFIGQDPDPADNRWLREAFENRIPIIYFLGIAPSRYQAMLPTFISGWDGKALKGRVSIRMRCLMTTLHFVQTQTSIGIGIDYLGLISAYNRRLFDA
jgi:hypothetical protein